MDAFHYTTQHKSIPGDTFTPLALYLKLRDVFPNTLLLESTDFHGTDNNYSYICFEPLAHFRSLNGTPAVNFEGVSGTVSWKDDTSVFKAFEEFRLSFKDGSSDEGIANSLFGYINFDAVEHFDKFSFHQSKSEVPAIWYSFYRFVLAFNHHKDEITLYENVPDTEKGRTDEVLMLVQNKNVAAFPFQAVGEEQCNNTDEDFLEMVRKAIGHCHRGDVFQLVLSRRFSRKFTGDDLNVYRVLRSINPSPYLFYFDYGNFRLFGSSPEAQLVVKNGTAKINPIAGTFRRTGDDMQDHKLAEKLAADPKENAEHVMLVDLARNDLSKHAHTVEVKEYKQIHFYSHVIHLVSEVIGQLNGVHEPLLLLADSFPAGTLSGAPKHMAIELINRYENMSRGFYGGCIGAIGLNGDINTAIMIRTFFSKDYTLHYQAGAGIVADSAPESELQEVHNKLAALRKAMEQSENFSAS